jgi:hypothetical protein
MKTPVVRIKIRIRLADESRTYADPVFSGNGKMKPLYASVAGNPEHHPEGVYTSGTGRRVSRSGSRSALTLK